MRTRSSRRGRVRYRRSWGSGSRSIRRRWARQRTNGDRLPGSPPSRLTRLHYFLGGRVFWYSVPAAVRFFAISVLSATTLAWQKVQTFFSFLAYAAVP